MAKIDPHEAAIIHECQRGIVAEYWRSGSFCRKRDLCWGERRCHFVAQAERHLERVWSGPMPTRIVWSRGFDPEPQTLSLFEAA